MRRFFVLTLTLGIGAIGAVLALVAAVIVFDPGPQRYTPSSYLPDCDSKGALDLLKDAINQSPSAKTKGVVVKDIGDARERDGSTASFRRCVALTYTNAGKIRENYTIEWVDAARTKFYLLASPTDN